MKINNLRKDLVCFLILFFVTTGYGQVTPENTPEHFLYPKDVKTPKVYV